MTLSPEQFTHEFKSELAKALPEVTTAEPRGKLDPARIVPVIKDREWLANMWRVGGGARKQVYEEFNDELIIVDAEDSPCLIAT